MGIAIVFNHQEIALRLLDHPDIDVNKKTCESTALHYAALRNNVVLLEAICAKPEVQVIPDDQMIRTVSKWPANSSEQRCFSTSGEPEGLHERWSDSTGHSSEEQTC